MSEKKSYQAWTISDEFWETIKDEIPKKEQDPAKKYKNAPGQGRKPMPARKALEGIFYVLRIGCQWKALPHEYGILAAVRRLNSTIIFHISAPVARRRRSWNTAPTFTHAAGLLR